VRIARPTSAHNQVAFDRFADVIDDFGRSIPGDDGDDDDDDYSLTTKKAMADSKKWRRHT